MSERTYVDVYVEAFNADPYNGENAGLAAAVAWARADERAKVLAELNKWICCTHYSEDDLLAEIDRLKTP